MIIVTGGAGFIGSNLVRGLNRVGIDDIVVVDDLTDGRKFLNLADCTISDYWDKTTLQARLRDLSAPPGAILHQGACAVTTEWNGKYMLAENYQYSVDVFKYCAEFSVPLIYASSASVYGASTSFREGDAGLEQPLNVYGYSKLLFDQYVRRNSSDQAAQVVGLRYFNVYGPREAHKGSMASVVHHFNQQLESTREVRLFDASGGYEAGEQRRDFIHVDDVVSVNLWFLENPKARGIFNVGTGRSASFNELASAVIDWHGHGAIRYIPFPEGLQASYQSFTEADIGPLRAVGYDLPFMDVRTGAKAYLDAIRPES